MVNVRPKETRITHIMRRWFFNHDTFKYYFTCYVIRATKKDLDGNKIRGWIFNGSLTEVWIPYSDLRLTMQLYSRILDLKDKSNGKKLVGE